MASFLFVERLMKLFFRLETGCRLASSRFPVGRAGHNIRL
jgi:hypothetical protein